MASGHLAELRLACAFGEKVGSVFITHDVYRLGKSATHQIHEVEAEVEKEAVMTELEQLANEDADLHSSCDFVLKNFEIRQTARDQEIEALKQAKAILSGAKFSEFLQQM